MKKSSVYFISVLFLLLASCNRNIPINKYVQTHGGKISGEYLEPSGVTVFKGVPFAAPPVGSLRWKAPQPAMPWEGVKECTKFRASPMQNTPAPFLMWTQEFIAPGEQLSEDCLYLNIWTGSKTAGEKRPVLVYIYGGAFSSGSGAVPVYDGEEMAKKGVVFITFNYRVGALGFLAHPGLTAESEYNSSGNYGLLDQIEVLKWVNRNIEAFGGDPANVTIAGQSAGAYSVCYLVASPLTKGLIHRAIAESGGAVLPKNNAKYGLQQAEKIGVGIARALGAASVEELRSKPAEEIVAVQGSASPVVDGYVVPGLMYGIFSKGQQNDIPLILGWNEDEGFGGPPLPAVKFKEKLQQQFGDKASSFLDSFPVDTDEEAYKIQNTLGSLQTFGIQSYKWMLLQGKTGKSKVFMYRFGRDLPFAEGMKGYGAFHTGEVPYAYNNLKMSPRPWSEADYKLAGSMSDYWANFAKNGNPNGEGLPVWEACTPDNLQAMVFDTIIKCTSMPDANILKFLDDYYSSHLH